jgi:hypothetical protein
LPVPDDLLDPPDLGLEDPGDLVVDATTVDPNLLDHDPDDRLRVAWDPVDGATGYEVHRSTDPGFVPDGDSVVATTSGEPCASPDVPTWPTASRDGLCWTDDGVTLGTSYYYRVVAVTDGVASEPSLLASGTPTAPDRQVKVKVDRLYGPGYWEYASTTADETEWSYTWDRLALEAELAIDVAARSYTQGVGSAAAAEIVDPEAPMLGVARGAGQVPGEDGDASDQAASFNLRAIGGEAPSLRFTFRDREADVQIRAIDVHAIEVSQTDNGGDCEVTGTAEVTRDGTTTTEPLILSCQDNGIPGRGQDVLLVETDSYVGGGTLIAGRLRVDADD